MTEKWREINGYDGVYPVSDLGQVRNTQTSKILHPTKLKNASIV
jgi:NUMOD4 motif-containing protein